MVKHGTMDLTTGRPVRQIFLFSVPLIVGTLFQQLYSFVDTVMVGRLIGDAALAAVGTTYSLYFLTLGFVNGSCVGFGIPLAQSIGARDGEGFKRYFWNGVWLCTALSVVVTAVMVALAEPLLRMIRTPEDILPQAALYIRVIFLGIPASILYNFCAAALRAAGDSQRPTYFLFASSCLNIALDYVFIALIPMGVAGAALATVLSQLVSGLLNLGWIVFKTGLLKNSVGLRAFSRSHAARLCKVGFPMGFDHSVSAMGMVIMQGAINSLGTAAIAGQTTGEKIRQMFTTPMESVGMGVATYAGQNQGAKRYDRIRSGIKAGLVIQYSYCAAVWLLIFFCKGTFVEFVLGAQAGESGRLAVKYLAIISCLFPIHGSLMVVRNTLQGMGYSLHAVFSGVSELAGRAIGSWMSVAFLGFTGICLSNPMAWGCGLVYCTIVYTVVMRQNHAVK